MYTCKNVLKDTAVSFTLAELVESLQAQRRRRQAIASAASNRR